TNDLDIETLDLLEEGIAEFEGTILVVSHDRVFLEHIVTSTLAFEGEGRITEYIGGYEDFVRQSGSVVRPATGSGRAEHGEERDVGTTVRSAGSVVRDPVGSRILDPGSRQRR